MPTTIAPAIPAAGPERTAQADLADVHQRRGSADPVDAEPAGRHVTEDDRGEPFGRRVEELAGVDRAVEPGRRRTRVSPSWSRPHPLTADPLRLRQALGNLVGNAIRHTPRGGRVTIVRKLAEAHGGTASAASTPGDGATVTLRLPVTPADGRSIVES